MDLARSKINDPAFRAKVSGVVTAVTDTINGFFDKLTETDGAGSSIAGNIGKLIGDGVGLALNTVNQFLTKVNWKNIGTAVAQGINGVLSSLNSNDINFGTVLGNILNAGIQGASGIITNLNWKALGTTLANNVNGFIGTVDWGSAGKTLSDGVKGAIDTISTALKEIDWKAIGTAIKDFIANIDWAGVASGLADTMGSLAGGLVTALWAAFGDAVTNFTDYFKQKINEAGGNVMAGIGQGIVDWFKDVGTWMYNNIWTPIYNGFKSTFSINSPSTDPKIQGLGSDLIHGLFNGVVSWVSNIGNWLKTNVWDKIVNGFRSLFSSNPISVTPNFEVQTSGSGTGGGGTGGSLFTSPELGITVDIYGNVVDVTGNGFDTKDGSVFAKIKGWMDGIRDKVPPQDKVIHGGGIVAEKMSDRLSTAQRTLSAISNFRWRRDSLDTNQRTISTVSKFSWASDGLNTNQRTIKTTSRYSWAADALSAEARKVKSTAYMVRLVDALTASNRMINVFARVYPGWSGSLAKALGIDKITTTLVLKTPRIRINWAEFSWMNTRYYYPGSFYTTYYARGGILDAATLLGLDKTGAHVAGEAGREAILPLEHHTEWMDKIAEKTAALLGGGNGRQVIENRIYLDGKVVADSTKQIWRSEARAGGDPLLGIA